MIDFNTVLNTLLDQIVKQASEPLMVRIAALEAQVKSLVEASSADFSGFAFRDAVSSVIDNYDFDDKFDRWAETGKTFDRAVEAVCDDAMSRHEREYDHDELLAKTATSDSSFRGQVETVIKDFVFDGEDDLEDAVKTVMNNMTLSLSVD